VEFEVVGLLYQRYGLDANEICAEVTRCHGLAPWSVTFAAISSKRETSTGQARGIQSYG